MRGRIKTKFPIAVTCPTCDGVKMREPWEVAAGRRYCSHSCWAKARTGEKNSRWKGGTSTHHAYATKLVGPNKYTHAHRLVVEAHIGRPLMSNEHVHHRNGDKTDNRIENLRVVSNSEHRIIHTTQGRWAINYDRCVDCGRTDRRHNAHGLCVACYERHRHAAQK